MRKILLLLLCVTPALPVSAFAKPQSADTTECSEKSVELFESAIDSLTKSYELNPDDPETKYFLVTAYTSLYVCLSNSYLAIPTDERAGPEGRKLLDKIKKIFDKLTELERWPPKLLDAPPDAPDCKTDHPAVGA